MGEFRTFGTIFAHLSALCFSVHATHKQQWAARLEQPMITLCVSPFHLIAHEGIGLTPTLNQHLPVAQYFADCRGRKDVRSGNSNPRLRVGFARADKADCHTDVQLHLRLRSEAVGVFISFHKLQSIRCRLCLLCIGRYCGGRMIQPYALRNTHICPCAYTCRGQEHRTRGFHQVPLFRRVRVEFKRTIVTILGVGEPVCRQGQAISCICSIGRKGYPCRCVPYIGQDDDTAYRVHTAHTEQPRGMRAVQEDILPFRLGGRAPCIGGVGAYHVSPPIAELTLVYIIMRRCGCPPCTIEYIIGIAAPSEQVHHVSKNLFFAAEAHIVFGEDIVLCGCECESLGRLCVLQVRRCKGCILVLAHRNSMGLVCRCRCLRPKSPHPRADLPPLR